MIYVHCMGLVNLGIREADICRMRSRIQFHNWRPFAFDVYDVFVPNAHLSQYAVMMNAVLATISAATYNFEEPIVLE